MSQALRASDMDIVGALFAVKFDGNIVELYIEDDDWYHLKARFNGAWLADLKGIADSAIDRLTR